MRCTKAARAKHGWQRVRSAVARGREPASCAVVARSGSFLVLGSPNWNFGLARTRAYRLETRPALQVHSPSPLGAARLVTCFSPTMSSGTGPRAGDHALPNRSRPRRPAALLGTLRSAVAPTGRRRASAPPACPREAAARLTPCFGNGGGAVAARAGARGLPAGGMGPIDGMVRQYASMQP